MAKKKRSAAPSAEEARAKAAEALGNLEQPKVNWKVVAQVGVGLLVLWVIMGMLSPYLGIWGFVVAGVLTAVVLGGGFYLYRMTRKSAALVDILKGATDAQGRAEAIAALQSGKGDAMQKIAEAQLLAQEDPKAALAVMESIDIDKAPRLVRNDVRAQLALMYLINNKVADAKIPALAIQLDQAPQAKQKAMYGAVKAEALARTGDAQAAAKILEGFDTEDAALAEMKPLLHRAEVFTWIKLRKKGRARTAMMRLARSDANQLAAFLQKGVHPEAKRLATEVAQREGLVPKPKMQVRMR